MRVSIITPFYNRERQLSNCIKSVLAQTHQDFEFLLVDDCSTDNSSNVVRSFSDDRIRLLKMPVNSGAAAARNVGITASTGSVISFLDSDDAYEPNFLEQSVQKIQTSSPDVGLIWTGLRYIRNESNSDKVSEAMWKPETSDPYRLFLSNLRIGTNSGISIRKEVFNQVGLFDETLPAAEDTDLFLRIAQKYNVSYVDKILINIYQHGSDRLSKRFDKIARAYNIIVPKHLQAIQKERALRLKFAYKCMWLNYHLGENELARKNFKHVLRDNFFSPGAWFIFFLFEILGRKLGSQIHTRLSMLSR
jgi:glycosyltransferase involved in cell wall biosynthesis